MRLGVPAVLGKVTAAFASLAVLALLARHLGPGPLGTIALIRTVAALVDSFANFNTWQALVKYGTEAVAEKRDADVRAVVKIAFLIDALTCVAGVIVIAAISLTVPSVFGATAEDGRLCAIYGLTLLTHLFGGTDGLYRLFDAYRLQAITTLVGSIVMVGSVALAVALDASMEGCLLAVAIGESIANVIAIAGALYVAKANGHGAWLQAPLADWRTRFPGIRHFLVSTNAQQTVKKASSELDMVIVGNMLGKVPSGLLRVVKQLSTIPQRIIMPFEQVLYTELARAAAAHDYAALRGLIRRSTVILAAGSFAMWAACALAAAPLIRLIAGDEFVGAAPALVIYMGAIALTITSSPPMRAIVILGRPGTLFWCDLATLALFIGAAIVGIDQLGLTGVCWALVLHRLVQLAWSWWLVVRIVRGLEAAHRPAETGQ